MAATWPPSQYPFLSAYVSLRPHANKRLLNNTLKQSAPKTLLKIFLTNYQKNNDPTLLPLAGLNQDTIHSSHLRTNLGRQTSPKSYSLLLLLFADVSFLFVLNSMTLVRNHSQALNNIDELWLNYEQPLTSLIFPVNTFI